MKSNLFKCFLVFQLFGLLLMSCTKNENTEPTEQATENIEAIISPNGVLMANSLAELKEKITEDVQEMFELETASFEIDSYEFHENEKETIVFIELKTESGHLGRIAKVKEVSHLRADGRCFLVVCDGGCESCNLTVGAPGGKYHTINCGCCEIHIREVDC